MSEELKAIGSQDEFRLAAGIGSELAAFLDEFFRSPDMVFTMTSEKRREIENKMNDALSSFTLG